MAPLTNYEANKYIDDRIKENLYIGLLKDDPGYNGDSSSEVTAIEYRRQSIVFVEPTTGITQNSNDVEFDIATSNWGIIKYIGLFDAETGGNMISYSKLNYDREVRMADRYTIPAGYNIFEIR